MRDDVIIGDVIMALKFLEPKVATAYRAGTMSGGHSLVCSEALEWF